MGGKTGEWGEGPAGATVPYDVPGLHAARGANWTAARGDNAQKLKNKTRAAAIPFFRSCHGPSALGSGRTLAPPARKVKSVPLARSMPILGAARGAHGEQHDLEITLVVAIAPFASRGVKHVLLPLKGCAAAHATRAARLTASSRRAVVRRLTTCPAQYHAGRVVRPQPVFGMVGGCVDRHFPLWTVLLFFVCRRAETAVHVDGL